jgi:hypothetical protein
VPPVATPPLLVRISKLSWLSLFEDFCRILD